MNHAHTDVFQTVLESAARRDQMVLLNRLQERSFETSQCLTIPTRSKLLCRSESGQIVYNTVAATSVLFESPRQMAVFFGKYLQAHRAALNLSNVDLSRAQINFEIKQNQEIVSKLNLGVTEFIRFAETDLAYWFLRFEGPVRVGLWCRSKLLAPGDHNGEQFYFLWLGDVLPFQALDFCDAKDTALARFSPRVELPARRFAYFVSGVANFGSLNRPTLVKDGVFLASYILAAVSSITTNSVFGTTKCLQLYASVNEEPVTVIDNSRTILKTDQDVFLQIQEMFYQALQVQHCGKRCNSFVLSVMQPGTRYLLCSFSVLSVELV